MRKSLNPFDGDNAGSFGDKQLNNDCGLSPLNGVNAWFASVAKNVAVPVPSAKTGDCEEPRSQSVRRRPARNGVIDTIALLERHQRTRRIPGRDHRERHRVPRSVTRNHERRTRRLRDRRERRAGQHHQSDHRTHRDHDRTPVPAHASEGFLPQHLGRHSDSRTPAAALPKRAAALSRSFAHRSPTVCVPATAYAARFAPACGDGDRGDQQPPEHEDVARHQIRVRERQQSGLRVPRCGDDRETARRGGTVRGTPRDDRPFAAIVEGEGFEACLRRVVGDGVVARGGGGVDGSLVTSAMARNVWSAVTAVLLVETRRVQSVKFVKPLAGERCDGARQLNSDCGLSPSNGRKARLRSVAEKVTIPRSSAMAGAGELPRSQCAVGDHCGVVGPTPSHCST